MNDLIIILADLNIEVLETNIGLGYGQLSYLVHYRNEDYLCIGLKNVTYSNTYCIGELVKFHKFEIEQLNKSEFKIQDSVLWNGAFVGWVVRVLIPKLTDSITSV